MPWQRAALDGQLEYDPDSPDPVALTRRYSLVSVARQNGKTVALLALVGWWLTECARLRGRPQTVVLLTNQLKLSHDLFEAIAKVLEPKYGAVTKSSYGRESLTMPDGSVLKIVADTPRAGHGLSPDLVVADEIWDVSEEAIDVGLIPAQRARRHCLLSMWSTAGTDQSRLMLRWRTEGLEQIDRGDPGRLWYAEWSVDPNSAYENDPALWALANPAIGITIDRDRLLEESQMPNRAAFLRGYLNLWISSDRSWLPAGLWETLRSEEPRLPYQVIAVDCSLDGERFAAVGAEVDDVGGITLSVIAQTKTQHELWELVAGQFPATAKIAVSPSLEIGLPVTWKPRSTLVGYGELVKWTAPARAAILEGRVKHRGDVGLADHMSRAVASTTQAGMALSSQKSPGPIELARLSVFVIALASASRRIGRPQIGISGRR